MLKQAQTYALIGILFCQIPGLYTSCTSPSNQNNPTTTTTAPANNTPQPATNSETTPPAPSNNLISCNGIDQVNLTDTEADIIRKYGQANVTRDTLYAEGMPVTIGTYVLRDTPREIQIIWEGIDKPGQDMLIPNFNKISSLVAKHEKSPYKTANGIQIGVTTVQDLQKLNGGVPLGFSGFGWDYGGSCCNFKGGAFEKEMPCIGFQLTYDEGGKPLSDKEMNAIMGDQEVLSDNKVLTKLRAYVLEISVHNKYPETK